MTARNHPIEVLVMLRLPNPADQLQLAYAFDQHNRVHAANQLTVRCVTDQYAATQTMTYEDFRPQLVVADYWQHDIPSDRFLPPLDFLLLNKPFLSHAKKIVLLNAPHMVDPLFRAQAGAHVQYVRDAPPLELIPCYVAALAHPYRPRTRRFTVPV